MMPSSGLRLPLRVLICLPGVCVDLCLRVCMLIAVCGWVEPLWDPLKVLSLRVNTWPAVS